MASPIPDLWPEQIAETTEVSPVSILNGQAALLGEKTQGFVEGEVTYAKIPPTSPLSRDDSWGYLSAIGELHEIPKAIALLGTNARLFVLREVPALDNYRFLLLTVLHGHKYYPSVLSYMITNESVRADSKDELSALVGRIPVPSRDGELDSIAPGTGEDHQEST